MSEKVIRVVSRGESFWRCNTHFTKTPSDYALDVFTPKELTILQNEPMLIVSIVDADTDSIYDEQYSKAFTGEISKLTGTIGGLTGKINRLEEANTKLQSELDKAQSEIKRLHNVEQESKTKGLKINELNSEINRLKGELKKLSVVKKSK